MAYALKLSHHLCLSTKWSQAKGCSVTISKRQEEITIKPKNLNLQTLAGSPEGEQLIVDLKFGLSCCFLSRQCRAVRNKSSHKSESCCCSLCVTCYCKLAAAALPAPGDLHRRENCLNEGSLYIVTQGHSQHHRNTFRLQKSSMKCHCASGSF